MENTPVIADSEVSPAAFLFQRPEEQDELNLLESQSKKVKCPYCNAVSYSIVEYRTNFLGYMLQVSLSFYLVF